MPVTRLPTNDDADVLAKLLRGNRAFLAPWQPIRGGRYFTDEGQHEVVEAMLEQHRLGNSVPFVILGSPGQVVETINIQSVIRGAFQSCAVGYWLAEDVQGRGLATTALREVAHHAFRELRLHRIQAETLVNNLVSQRVLARVGFRQYGVAPKYLKIAGQWQDNLLYQLLTPEPELVDCG